MIGWLQGRIVAWEDGHLLLNVGGVGYEVETSALTREKLQGVVEVALYIQMIVREDAMLLYGFADTSERALFRALVKVNGVGPRLAITILSGMDPGFFLQAINLSDVTALSKIPGIGKKTAERIIMEMQGKFDAIFAAVTPGPLFTARATEQNEAVAALLALGYRPQEAAAAVNKVNDGNKACETIIRDALKLLAI